MVWVGFYIKVPGSGFVTYPPRLNDLMVTIETVLNLHQLLKVILKKHHQRGEETHEAEADRT